MILEINYINPLKTVDNYDKGNDNHYHIISDTENYYCNGLILNP